MHAWHSGLTLPVSVMAQSGTAPSISSTQVALISSNFWPLLEAVSMDTICAVIPSSASYHRLPTNHSWPASSSSSATSANSAVAAAIAASCCFALALCRPKAMVLKRTFSSGVVPWETARNPKCRFIASNLMAVSKSAAFDTVRVNAV